MVWAGMLLSHFLLVSNVASEMPPLVSLWEILLTTHQQRHTPSMLFLILPVALPSSINFIRHILYVFTCVSVCLLIYKLSSLRIRTLGPALWHSGLSSCQPCQYPI